MQTLTLESKPSEQPVDRAQETTVEQTHEALDIEFELTKGFAAKLIGQKARQLVGLLGITKSDLPDLRQDLKLALFKRHSQFNPQIANWEAFSTTIVENEIATMIVMRSADKREYARNVVSLSEQVVDPDGETVDLSAQIGEADLERITGLHWPHHEDEPTRVHDVAAVLSKLPPELAEICRQLKEKSITKVGEDMSIPKTTVYHILAQLREVFLANGFSAPRQRIPDDRSAESVVT